MLVPVVLYTQPHCAPCRQVEQLLAGIGVEYGARNVLDDDAALRDLEAQGYLMTPVTRIGSDWIVGFRRDQILDALRRHGLTA